MLTNQCISSIKLSTMKAKSSFQSSHCVETSTAKSTTINKDFQFWRVWGGGGWGVHRESEEKKKSVHGPSPLQGSTNLVQSRGPWTSGLCFFLTQEHGADSKLLLICPRLIHSCNGFSEGLWMKGRTSKEAYNYRRGIISGIEKVL